LGLTLHNVASSLQISEKLLTKIESGEKEPSFALLIRFADIFNVSTDYLIGRIDLPEVNEMALSPETEKRAADYINTLIVNQDAEDKNSLDFHLSVSKENTIACFQVPILIPVRIMLSILQNRKNHNMVR